MIGGRAGFVVARLLAGGFALVTAVYCVLAYIPFTYHQIHLGALLPWLSAFAAYHPYLYWPVFILAALTLPDLRNDRTRGLTLLFVAVYGLTGCRLVSSPLLTRLGNDRWDLLWCVVALTPLAWMAALDWLAQGDTLVWTKPGEIDTRRVFRASALSAACVWLLSTALSVARYGANAGPGFSPRQWAEAATASAVSHIAVFLAIFLLLNFAGAVARVCSPKPAVHLLSCLGAIAALASLAFRYVIFAPLSFTGLAANLVALAMAAGLIAFLSGISVRLYRASEGAIESPLALLLTPFGFLRRRSKTMRAAILLTIGAAAAFALVRTSKFDWGYVLQTLIVVCTWMAAFAFFYLSSRPSRRDGADARVIAAAAVLCLYLPAARLLVGGHFPSGSPIASWRSVLEEYGNYDVGYRLARAALSRPRAGAADESLYAFLTSNTNIPRSVRTDPVDVNLAGTLTPAAGAKPNIFIFVIDSLRRDYLSPYNPAARFTPAVEEFARASFVFQNAFTRYAGTGLSEPSIWAGGMLLHKQYVTPFYPMNALQKLLDFEGYRQFITKDEVLASILKPSSLMTELDAGRPTMSCELCQTLAELQTRIGQTSTERPIFAYSQPQNIHVSVINREGRSVGAGEDYPGFDAAYASRVRAMDQCFGRFIQFLKNQGLYENSVVILSSDHGDSLGERGQWGHAYHVVPEVVRIPLLVHLPKTMLPLVSDLQAPSFLVDITPSLYYLLGHKPVERNEIFGRPLFTATAAELSRSVPDSYLIASSYGPVYAILSSRGRWLYVADGVEYKDYLYDLADKDAGSAPITPEMRADRQQEIRDYVTDIERFYHFDAADDPPR